MDRLNQIALRQGATYGLGLVVFGVCFRIANVPIQSPLTWVFYAVLPLVAWISIRQLRRDNPRASFKAMFEVGSYATIVASVIYVISVVLYNALVDASLLKEIETYLRQAAIDAGKVGAALEEANRYAKIFTQPGLFAIVVFIQLAIAGVSSALSFAIWNVYRNRRAAPVVIIGR